MPDQPVARVPLALARHRQGQALVLYALFLLVLLGASALAVDYANWLLIDRRLQNVADHASLAGAAMFDDQFVAGSCAGVGQPQCDDARAQAWASLNEDLNLGLTDADITTLSASDTPVAGQTTVPGTSTPLAGGHTIWVTTPPPANASYQGVGGRYTNNYAVVFVRVDEPTTTYFGRALGLGARDRIGWATAGPLPTDFALEVFCRNNIPPEHGACGGSGATSLVIDGQGGIRLVRGDIGSNESLKVTATNGQGVIVQAGNVFVVEGSCSNALWTCPDDGTPTQGGISDGTNGKNAFFMPPQPIPHYASPLDGVTVSSADCAGADASDLCVPYRGQPGAMPNQPGNWSCDDPSLYPTSSNPCGRAIPASGAIRCVPWTPSGLDPSPFLIPWKDLKTNTINGVTENGNNQKWQNIDDDSQAAIPDADTTNPPASPPTDYVHLQNNLNPGANRSFEVALRPPFGSPPNGTTTVRYAAFKTHDLTPTDAGNQVDLVVYVLENNVVIWTSPTETLTGTPTQYSFTISGGTITNYNALSLEFEFSTPGGQSNDNADKNGGGVSWAEAETPSPLTVLPPMIPPGYYHSITVPNDGWCAVLDPTAVYRPPASPSDSPGLERYQLPGIYRFGGGSDDAKIEIGAGSFLIGDAVTLVFNPEFPDPTGGRGIIVRDRGALVLNTMRVPGTPPCTPTETESTTYNPSSVDPSDPDLPLSLLPYSSVCAAWTVDSDSQTGVHAGLMAWPIPMTELALTGQCGDPTLAQPVARDCYEVAPTPANYRGITFYFTPDAFPATSISGRFQMSAGGGGCTGNEPGIAFKGVLYAPYDDVIISGGSSFATVGQVLAWTAKFNGACAAIDLDYPYDPAPAPPYLLEPGIGQ
ncbi:MAG: Tad domain-containing protein [Chloroflexi bacterium]|nr:Tad domain-containing protein [Chloroflexota bacterium]